MLHRTELALLNGWCRTRGLFWVPGRVGEEAVVLVIGRRCGGDPMLLVVDAAELHLVDAAGQELAAASNLQALLDALDGGVADQPTGAGWPLRLPIAPGEKVAAAA